MPRASTSRLVSGRGSSRSMRVPRCRASVGAGRTSVVGIAQRENSLPPLISVREEDPERGARRDVGDFSIGQEEAEGHVAERTRGGEQHAPDVRTQCERLDQEIP